MERGTRQGKPTVEGLEERRLLSASATKTTSTLVTEQPVGIITVTNRNVFYTIDGTHVTISLYGVGSLAGSSLNADGSLNLVYSGTDDQTAIYSHVTGGTRQAALESVLPANVAPQTLSGVGASPLYLLNLRDFNLDAGGQVNLTAGVHTFQLNSVGPDTQVNLRELPESMVTGGNSTQTASGQTLTYVLAPDGGQVLASVTGQFTPGKNLPLDHTAPDGLPTQGAPPSPSGIIAVVNHVDGPSLSSSGLPDSAVFAYDATANALVRFDVAVNPANGNATGTPDLTIPSPFPAGAAVAGVALARDGNETVALVGSGTTVVAYNASTGALVGSFSTASLASAGFQTVSGIGATDTETVLEDVPDNVLQIINLSASLATGQAVPVGAAFTPTREFTLTGGLTGVPGSTELFATGTAHFDTAQPNLLQLGVMTLNTANGQLGEVARNPFKSNGIDIDVGAPGSFPTYAVGSLGQDLAVLTETGNGVNVATLYTQALGPSGTLTLNDADPLTDLSESFRPGLAGTALFDIQGNVQSFRAKDAQGLVLNDLGNLNLAKITTATDTTIVGEPFSHAAIPHRQNVTILTTSRLVGDRNGVVIEPDLGPVGPLSQPND